MEFDRDYYTLVICEKYGDNEIDEKEWFAAVNKAIDKTLKDYTVNGKFLVEDWDMFDQELDTNVWNELEEQFYS